MLCKFLGWQNNGDETWAGAGSRMKGRFHDMMTRFSVKIWSSILRSQKQQLTEELSQNRRSTLAILSHTWSPASLESLTANGVIGYRGRGRPTTRWHDVCSHDWRFHIVEQRHAPHVQLIGPLYRLHKNTKHHVNIIQRTNWKLLIKQTVWTYSKYYQTQLWPTICHSGQKCYLDSITDLEFSVLYRFYLNFISWYEILDQILTRLLARCWPDFWPGFWPRFWGGEKPQIQCTVLPGLRKKNLIPHKDIQHLPLCFVPFLFCLANDRRREAPVASLTWPRTTCWKPLKQFKYVLMILKYVESTVNRGQIRENS